MHDFYDDDGTEDEKEGLLDRFSVVAVLMVSSVLVLDFSLQFRRT